MAEQPHHVADDGDFPEDLESLDVQGGLGGQHMDEMIDDLNSGEISQSFEEIPEVANDMQNRAENEEQDDCEHEIFLNVSIDLPIATNSLNQVNFSKCYHCEDSFVTKVKRQVHMLKYHRGMKNYKCPTCKQMMIDKKNYNLHMKRHHDESSRFKCTLCEKSFVSNSARCLHVRKFHNKERNVLCTKCNNYYFDNYDLNAHIKLVHGRPFQCKNCRRKFNTLDALNHHIKDKQESPDRAPGCDKCCHCCKVSSSQEVLNVHMASVHPHVILFDCTQCDCKFTTESGLSDHVITMHTAENPSGCSTGGKRCNSPPGATAPIKKGRGKDLFKCDLCKKTHVSQRSLDLHIKNVHQSDMPHQCLYCEKSFNKKTHKKAHMYQCCKRNNN